MTNLEMYNKVFCECFDITPEGLGESLVYQGISAWDSVGHMTMIAALEEEFDVMLDIDDITDFASYDAGMKILAKYGVLFD